MSSLKEETKFDEVELPTDPSMPAWIITPKEEKVIFERWRKKTFARCDEFIKAYIECTNLYTNMDAVKNCKSLNDTAQGCVAKYQKMEFLDEERDILIKEKMEKKKLYKEYLRRMKEKQNTEKGA